jgi:hypothetical protein
MNETIFNLFEGGRGNDLPGVAGTYWAAYNAITEHLSYGISNTQDNRLDSLWFGMNSNRNDQALQKSLELAGVYVA